MTEHEVFLRAFHARHAGITARAMERGGSYDRLAARAGGGRILDLACGDGALLARLSITAIGLDSSPEELVAAAARIAVPIEITDEALGALPARLSELGLGVDLSREELRPAAVPLAPGRLVCGRAQQLPFADASFETVVCHLAFMLFDDIERVVAELHRVLVPGGRFIALLGGGPTAEGRDAFHDFLDLVPRSSRRFGDPRAKSEAGWRALFAGWSEPVFERWPIDLSGSFDEVWTFLGASYELPPGDDIRAKLAAMYTDARVPCTVVTFCASVTRR